ncbi:MAG: acetolactate synthase small subunit [Anaerolineales bacterium]|nr:acetolactate synthase small subunit [Anaerolineales bacterium]MCX7755514.1 acetolactate synthase small subunit [Anaerolineales bacterium]MDW8279441.1 acetolactate synthase small subunit [Anaerolineales bacterium]
MQYTFVTLVENKPGVLNRVASLFRRRNFNIESLAVGRTENPDISRMTIVVECADDWEAHKIEANLYKLVNVIDVQDVTRQPAVFRDLALIKVKAGPEQRAEVNSLAQIFRARIVDVAADSVIVEVTGTEEKIEGMIELLRPIGILEMVRTGQIAMTRGAYEGTRRAPGANGNGWHGDEENALAEY